MRILPYVLLLFIPLCASRLAYSDSLYVYVPSNERAIFIQKQMLEACPELDITVFGRSSSFQSQIEKNTPMAILTLPVVVERQPAYAPAVQGERQGVTREPVVLLSLDKAVDLNKLESLSIGVLDILGRKPMQQYMNQIFKAKIKIRRVVKIEDLVPLLMLNMADAVFITKSEADKQKQKLSLDLVETPLSIELGLNMGAVQNSTQEKRASFIVPAT